MFLRNGTRESVYSCKGSKISDVDIDQLRKITKAGELIKRLRCKIVSRETYIRPDLVSCSVSEGTTSIVVLGSALGPHDWSRDQYVMIADAEAAVENELEKVNTVHASVRSPGLRIRATGCQVVLKFPKPSGSCNLSAGSRSCFR
jgi:hypothetical protein